MGILASTGSITPEAMAGIVVAHVAHCSSMLILHELTLVVWHSTDQRRACRIAFIAAALHIIAPAGMFLSAPYAESPFSLLNFTGCYFYAVTYKDTIKAKPVLSDCFVLLCGMTWGVATLFRSNGLFSGLVLIFDAFSSLVKILQHVEIQEHVHRLSVTVLSGVLMALVASIPQYLAYVEYCAAGKRYPRSWCSNRIPSIYAWVQKDYW